MTERQAISAVRDQDGKLVFEGTRMYIPRIIGWAITVGDFEEAKKEFIDGYPWLTGEHFDAAVNYYKEHQEEIDEEIAKDKRLRELLIKHSRPGMGVDIGSLHEDPEYQALGSR